MIASIRLENYRTHKDTFVEMTKFTAIKGENDAGKTGILKGLRATLLGTNIPVSHIKRGEAKAVLTVVLTNGRKIIRTRTLRDNMVTLIEADGTKVLDGTTVRDAQDTIRAFTGFQVVTLTANDEATEPQFANSREPLDYLLNKSPAAMLGIMTRLGSGHGIETAVYRLKAQTDTKRKELASVQKQLLDELLRIEQLRKVDLDDLQAKLSYVQEAEALVSRIRRMVDLIEQVRVLVSKPTPSLTTVDVLTAQRDEVIVAQKENQRQLKLVQGVPRTTIDLSLLRTVEQRYQKRQKTNEAVQELATRQRELETCKQLTADLARYEQELKSIKLPELCTVCGQVMP